LAESSFTLDTSKFKSGKHLDLKIRRAMFGVCKYWDGRVETHMKTRAPWTDRTTNARNGLAAEAVKLSRSRFAIILTHAVEYGIFLEVKNNGKYAIIMPTIKVYAPKVMKTLTNIMDRLDRAVGG
jgi:hypothetical protein